MDSVITKRLHISGLSTSISQQDLLSRLSAFGTVKSADGFGLKDGVGQPRKFGYVTIETTPTKLAKCLNSLSGSTWKGTKLRIGEAKPDFAERLVLERQGPSEEPPKKKRKRFRNRNEEDMSLVTPENVIGRAGWKVTPLGRIIRPIRMRPERPLPLIHDEESKAAARINGKQGKKRITVKAPDIRARRKTIDMTRWGSIYLKGSFLDFEVPGIMNDGEEAPPKSDTEIEGSATESDDDEERVYVLPSVPPHILAPTIPLGIASPVPASTTSIPAHRSSRSPQDTNIEFTAEKDKSLDLLASLFGGQNGIAWVGRESVGSDIDEEGLTKGQAVSVEESNEDFEIVPMEDDITTMTERVHQESTRDSERDLDHSMEAEPEAPLPPSTQKLQQATKLQHLFGPREEEAGFSLLGHLELDLELDDEVPFATSTIVLPTEEQYLPSYTVPSTLQLDPKQALFFPQPPTASNSTKARPRDLFDVAKDNRWNWRDPRVGFFRTETEEEIRKEWEGKKVELTRDWKKRWREAGKISRRKGGTRGEGEVPQ